MNFIGDYWHGNPEIYFENELPLPENKSINFKDIHEKDQQRIEAIKKELNCEILIIWENEYRKNKEQTLEKVINFLR